MMRVLFLLLPLLTDRTAVTEVLHCAYQFAAVNATILCVAGSLQTFRWLRQHGHTPK